MAVLGFQLVTTLIGACILSKIVTYFSCTRFVFDGLSRFIAPSDQLLIEASGSFKTRNKYKKRRVDAINGPNSNTSSLDRFYFPRALPIQLQSSVITHTDVAILPLYSSFQWLLDFTVCTVGIYFVTELANSSLLSSHNSASSNWSAISPPTSSTSNAFSLSTRLNLSLVWLVLVVWFTLRVLVSMTAIYFRARTPELHKAESRPLTSSTAPNSGEWFLVVVTGFCFLILTGFFMALDGRYFEFELQPAYTNLTMNTTVSPGVPLISWGAFNAILAFTCASIGALFVYPGMKFGRTYLDAVS
ncbi:transmembrane protein 161B [Clonorchis sinensis]|uniref:Transmembrane protein 161B n=1 Tax=Clonorchis sinensis TaxID=79923 RepID=G7YKV3_CLOSI|nr:transmembrane protein 161B [Clonorchis sinensis]